MHTRSTSYIPERRFARINKSATTSPGESPNFPEPDSPWTTPSSKGAERAPRLRPLRPASDDRAEFLDQAAAALGSLSGIAEFEGEAGHGTEIQGRIALV